MPQKSFVFLRMLKLKPTLSQLQWMVWGFVYLVLFLSLIAMDGALQAAVYALLNCSFYAAIVYGNILFLFPRLYQKGKLVLYVIGVIIFLSGMGLIRAFVTVNIYNALFAEHPAPINGKSILTFLLGGVMVFLLSFIFRIAIAYFALKQQSDEIIAQKTQAELDLLKSQVQPHFLFNTLNNIYYEAYLEAPRTAALIEKLSDIMRYFVDESPQALVSLGTEIAFIENYIALEKIRIRYEVNIKFNTDCDTTANIPPMLLMTFVENVFKHGIDKSSKQNKCTLSLQQLNGRLIYTVTNTIPRQPLQVKSTGFGIGNLRKRLSLLYGNNFELDTSNNGSEFTATLNIPQA